MKFHCALGEYLFISNWKTIFSSLLVLLLLLTNIEISQGETGKRRRQVFREDLSPLLGGRVPSGAFDWARLMFNNLDSRGISIPDGFILSNDRHPPEGVRSQERRIKLYSQDGNGFIDSTYTVRNPVRTSVKNFQGGGQGQRLNHPNSHAWFRPSPTDVSNWEEDDPPWGIGGNGNEVGESCGNPVLYTGALEGNEIFDGKYSRPPENPWMKFRKANEFQKDGGDNLKWMKLYNKLEYSPVGLGRISGDGKPVHTNHNIEGGYVGAGGGIHGPPVKEDENSAEDNYDPYFQGPGEEERILLNLKGDFDFTPDLFPPTASGSAMNLMFGGEESLLHFEEDPDYNTHEHYRPKPPHNQITFPTKKPSPKIYSSKIKQVEPESPSGQNFQDGWSDGGGGGGGEEEGVEQSYQNSLLGNLDEGNSGGLRFVSGNKVPKTKFVQIDREPGSGIGSSSSSHSPTSPKPTPLIHKDPLFSTKPSNNGSTSSSKGEGESPGESLGGGEQYREQLIDDIIARVVQGVPVSHRVQAYPPPPPHPHFPPPPSILKVTVFTPNPSLQLPMGVQTTRTNLLATTNPHSQGGLPPNPNQKKRKTKFKTIFSKLFESFQPE